MVNKYKLAGLFGIAHGVNDFIAGFLLSNLSTHSINWKQNSIAFLLYSTIAFGGQLPAGIMVDKTQKVKLFSVLSLVLMLLSILFFYQNIFIAILLSSVASAFIHVCGGAVCFNADNKKATLAGLFTAPGVLGLIIGGVLGASSFTNLYVFSFLLLLLLLVLLKSNLPTYTTQEIATTKHLLETHDFFMLILFLAIAFRSLFWNIIHIYCLENKMWLLAIGISAFLGKLFGGFMYDKVDGKKFIMISILFSAILLNVGKQNIWIISIGTALLQSAVPITLLMVQQFLKNKPATGAGIALGMAIALAGLPTYFQEFRSIQNNWEIFIAISILFLTTNYWTIKKYYR